MESMKPVTTDTTVIPVTVWYDYICPWCYVGMARLERLHEEFNLAVTFKTFYLRPDIPPEGRARESKDGAKPGEPVTGHVAEEAAKEGLVMRRAALTPNSRLSFEATEYAKERGLVEPFHRECYRAYWEDGANLGDITVLQGLADRVGLDKGEMKKKLEIGVYTDQAQKQYEEALYLGVRGIPSFIIGRYFFSGAQPLELFKQVAQKARVEQLGLHVPGK